jgi:hypothetical protein
MRSHRHTEQFKFQRGKGKTLLIACGALGREIIDVIEANQLGHLDVICLPAHLHHTPEKIAPEVRIKIRQSKNTHSKIYVLYGDCGTSGLLDRVLQEEGNIERIPGPHCFSFFMGNTAFSAESEVELGTFYLTDYFCRHFDTFIWEALGLDRRADMVEFVFGNYKRLLFMPQVKDEALEVKARSIANRLNLKYEYRFCGYGELAEGIKHV